MLTTDCIHCMKRMQPLGHTSFHYTCAWLPHRLIAQHCQTGSLYLGCCQKLNRHQIRTAMAKSILLCMGGVGITPPGIGLLNFSHTRPVGDAGNGGLEELHHVAGEGAGLVRQDGVHHSQLLHVTHTHSPGHWHGRNLRGCNLQWLQCLLVPSIKHTA